MRLYHGGHGGETITVTERSRGAVEFGGVFCSDSSGVAELHGARLYAIELEDESVLEGHYGYDEALSALAETVVRERLGASATNEEVEAIVDAISSPKCVVGSDYEHLLGDEYDSSGGWEAQRLRGLVARRAGYAAVEMYDEHGVTYLVLKGTLRLR